MEYIKMYEDFDKGFDKFIVLSNAGSSNKCSVGDILEIDGDIKIVTQISKRKVYLDGVAYDKRVVDKAKRMFIYHKNRFKSMDNNDNVNF